MAIKSNIDCHSNWNCYIPARQGWAPKHLFRRFRTASTFMCFASPLQQVIPNNESPAIVDNTLLVDRFVLSGTVLKLSREIRSAQPLQNRARIPKRHALCCRCGRQSLLWAYPWTGFCRESVQWKFFCTPDTGSRRRRTAMADLYDWCRNQQSKQL